VVTNPSWGALRSRKEPPSTEWAAGFVPAAILDPTWAVRRVMRRQADAGKPGRDRQPPVEPGPVILIGLARQRR
jgi:hypothetical protein